MPTDHEPPRKTAAEILAMEDTPTDDVYVKEWDTKVQVRGLTKRQQLDIADRSRVDGQIDESMSQGFIFQQGTIDPHFEEEEIAPLFEKNAGAVDTVIGRILELSGMKPEANRGKEARFPAGLGLPVPVQSGAGSSQDGSGVVDGAEYPDQR